jgi:DNA-directed RNA polymerase subunit RPC12/RpoP
MGQVNGENGNTEEAQRIEQKDLQNVKTRFIKDGSIQDGILRDVGYNKQEGKIKLKSELASASQGKLELSYKDPVKNEKEKILLKQKVEVECYEYGLEDTEESRELFPENIYGEKSESDNNNNDRKRLLELMQGDYDRVAQEIIQERSSRGMFFVTTLGAMSTAAFALIALTNSSEESLPRWILWGTLIPMILLIISILVTIQKTRAINLRTSYLAALNSCIAGRTIPKFFGGWQNALSVHRLCNFNLWHKMLEPRCQRSTKKRWCMYQAQRFSYSENKFARIWKGLFFESFTVFSTIIYGLLFLAWGTAFIWLFAEYIKIQNGIGTVVWPSILFAVLMVSLIFVINYLLRTSKAAHKRLEASSGDIDTAQQSYFINIAFCEKIRKIHSLCNICCGLVGLAAVVGFVLYLSTGEKIIGEKYAKAVGIIMVSVFLLAIITKLCLEYHSLRKGEHSMEFLTNLWLIRLELCPWATGQRVWRKDDIPPKSSYSCNNCGKKFYLSGTKELEPCKYCGGTLFFAVSRIFI